MTDQGRIDELNRESARLAAALEESLCGRCGGQGWYPWFDGNGVETHQQPCEKCRGTGHPQPDPTALRDLLGPVEALLSRLIEKHNASMRSAREENCTDGFVLFAGDYIEATEQLTRLRAVMGKEKL